jgi:hypothetical protein
MNSSFPKLQKNVPIMERILVGIACFKGKIVLEHHLPGYIWFFIGYWILKRG